ncbi:SMP-30/gluconolactonase/LRE family protein [Caenimonas koreensis]|uniref:SMP-30/gluconolactonase/LRE family protein n=1 Tax=Caenimonas koreensis TaxID=367474 RepID=UPI003783EA76
MANTHEAATWSPVTTRPDLLGESPFWHPVERKLYWVDIDARQVRRMDPAGGQIESWAMPQEPGCMAPAQSGGLVMALRDGIYRAASWGGALTLVARFAHDTATTRFNDGKADPRGRFWAGTMYEPRDARKAELYSVDLRHMHGSPPAPLIETKAGNAIIANGLAWSPDAATVYWTDTTHHVISVWDWDAQSNAMANHRVFRQFPGRPAGWKPGEPGYGGRPDGASVDSEGNYWVAMFEGGRVLKLSPAGEVLSDIAIPVRCPTMPCFGGDDLRTLYVTSASKNRSPQELHEMPLSGCVLSMRVDVPGLPVNFVSG